MNPSNDDWIAHSRPSITVDDIEAVQAVLLSGRLTTGEAVDGLESAFSKLTGRAHSIAVSSGTAALHLALLALKVGEGDEVLLPSYACTAVLNAIHYVKADPVLVDTAPEGYNSALPELRKHATRRSRAIVVPHMFGYAADCESMLDLGIPVIEDCAMALGTRRNGIPIGATGHVAVYSLYSTKMIAAGQGGMICTDAPDVEKTVRDLRHYDKKASYAVRYNYGLTDLSAALAASQLKRLDEFIARRRQIALIYNEHFKGLPFSYPAVPEGWNAYRYILEAECSFRQARRFFLQRSIDVAQPVFKPLHRYLHRKQSEYPNSERAYKRCISLPIYPALDKLEIERIWQAVQDFARSQKVG